MLKHLIIQNYALIRHLGISPAETLNIITGETGAGKSIMLGAVGLLLGNRADTKALFSQEEKCIIEGEFDIREYALKPLFEELELDYEDLSVVRREISPSGKSRAFINDTPVNLEALRKVGSRLVDVHSQHDTLLLASQDYQLEIIDALAGNQQELVKYQESFREYKRAEKAYGKLLEESQEMQKVFDYNSHLLQELEKVGLEDLDQAGLEEELEVLENAENIKSNLNIVLEYFSRSEFAIESGLKTAINSLNQIAGFSKKYEYLRDRAKSLEIEFQDIHLEVEKEESDLFLDMERIQFIKDKLDEVYALQNRHRVKSVEELISLREDIREKVDRVLNFDDDLKKADGLRKQLFSKVLENGKSLSASRKGVFAWMEKEINQLLLQLGMPNGRIQIDHKETKPENAGIDEINILFSANKGVSPEGLKNVASGGEFSRLMLAIKYILAQKIHLPTVIFDEIDTGISGEIAMKVGKMLLEMGGKHQVIAISHLPQIAAKGERHFFVYKDDSSDRAVSKIRELDKTERVQEIAQMIGGANPSQVAYQSAKELMG